MTTFLIILCGFGLIEVIALLTMYLTLGKITFLENSWEDDFMGIKIK